MTRPWNDLDVPSEILNSAYYSSSNAVDTSWFTASDTVDRLFSGESWHIANVILFCQLFISHAVHFVGQLITNTDECL